jgi:broad specificity phosphatase PhoE
MKIYLIRHAEEGEDGGLSELGQEQALDLAKWLQDKGLRALYSSDRPRASETAEIVAPNLQLSPRILPHFEEVRELEPLESIEEARERAEGGLLYAVGKNTGRNIAVVAHSKLIRQLLAKFNLREFVDGDELPNTGVVILGYNEGKFKLLGYAVVP